MEGTGTASMGYCDSECARRCECGSALGSPACPGAQQARRHEHWAILTQLKQVTQRVHGSEEAGGWGSDLDQEKSLGCLHLAHTQLPGLATTATPLGLSPWPA